MIDLIEAEEEEEARRRRRRRRKRERKKERKRSKKLVKQENTENIPLLLKRPGCKAASSGLGLGPEPGALGAVQLKWTSTYLCTLGHASSPKVATDASMAQLERSAHLREKKAKEKNEKKR